MQFRFHHLVLSVGTIFVVVSVGLLLVAAMQNPPALEGEQEESVPVSESSSSMIFRSNRLLTDDALSLAKLDDASEYDRVEARGGEILSLDSGNTYGVWWEPEGFDAEHDVVLVSLGGHGGWATKDFDVWYPEISDRGYAFFSLQWWLGRSLENNGYYEPEEMYAMIRQVLLEKGVTPGNVIFNTYSMSSARSYAMTGLDRVSEDFFALTISNSGVWEESYPPNEEIVNGTYGPQPFADHPWVLYCATHDEEHPDWNACEAMDDTQTFIESYAGVVKLYIKDDVGGHGSFMVNRENVRKALDLVDTIVTGS